MKWNRVQRRAGGEGEGGKGESEIKGGYRKVSELTDALLRKRIESGNSRSENEAWREIQREEKRNN